jgi:hypothetical protein
LLLLLFSCLHLLHRSSTGTAELYIYQLLIVSVEARQDGDPRSEDYDPGTLQQQQQLQHQSM